MNLEIFRLMKASEEYSKAKLKSNDAKSIHWDLSHCVFVEQNCTKEDLKEFIEKNKSQIMKSGVIKVYIDADNSKRVIEKAFMDWSLYIYNRVIYEGNSKKVFEDDRNNEDVGLLIKSEQQYANLEALKDEIISTWDDLDTFMQNGFGVCNVKDNCIRGWCLSEYNSPGKCGVGIETIEQYQRKGIALGMTKSFLNKCKDRNVIPYWDSWEWNTGSIKTAEKSGFELVQKYQTYFIKSK